MLLPLAAVILLGLLWTVYWVVAMDLAREEFAGQRERWGREGWHLACREESWGGYPFRFEYLCDSAEISKGTEISARSGTLRLVALAYKPWHVLALLDGPTLFAARGSPVQEVVHDRILASLRFGDDRNWTVSVEIPQSDTTGWASWDEMNVHVRTAPQGAHDVAVSVKGLLIVTEAAEPLRIDEGVLRGTLDASYRLAVERIDLRHRGIACRGTGELSLDSGHRPQGRLATETNDLPGLMNLLEPHLSLNDRQRGNLRMLAGLMGQTARIDLVAQDGAFFVGPLKVAELVPLY